MDEQGTLHMYSALMDEDCSLGAWLSNSRVLHATSSALDRPFEAKEVALGPRNSTFWDSLTQHNPTVARAPDGTWLIYYMGNHATDGQVPQNCTHAGASVGGLSPLAQVQRVGVASSKSPNGPWAREPSPALEPGPKGEWDDMFTTNPTVHVFPNGTVLLVYKGRSFENSNSMFTGVAVAPSWRGPYQRVGTRPIANVPTDCEDAGIFRGRKTGRFFGIFHCGCNYLSMQSTDGLDWQVMHGPTPWCSITFDDGSNTTLRRRERPQFVLGPDGDVVGMTNGVEPPSDLHGGRVFTMLSTVAKA